MMRITMGPRVELRLKSTGKGCDRVSGYTFKTSFSCPFPENIGLLFGKNCQRYTKVSLASIHTVLLTSRTSNGKPQVIELG